MRNFVVKSSSSGTKTNDNSSKASHQVTASAKSQSPPTPFVPQCLAVLDSLCKIKSASDFMVPVDVVGYTNHVPHPMDLSTVREKLTGGKYGNAAEFAKDVRRVFGNCLRYNFQICEKFREARQNTAHFRGAAKACLAKFETEWLKAYPVNSPSPVSV
jgi:hypothetical protein